MGIWGVSFGGRLFRVGQSPDGRWWGYFNILGFRFFRYFDSNGRKHWTRKSQNIPYYTPNSYQPGKSTGYRIPSPSTAPGSSSSISGSAANPIGSASSPQSPQNNASSLAQKNQQALDAIKQMQNPDQIN